MSDGGPSAKIHVIDGQVVLEDPTALAMIHAVERHNCKQFAILHQKDRLIHFTKRVAERGMQKGEAVIVIINVDSFGGKELADILMPTADWQPYRDKGEIPIARGIVLREGIQEMLDHLDPEEGELLRENTNLPVLIVDHDIFAVFDVSELVL